ncbi:water stress/hypersensitive response domain-containing protein [Burkholderia singularis]|uniref:Phosphonate ABC transporter phosphate-binding periplasmic component (TC 3.A.1.9.1) n=1 Tax=Burkholderia singularis TaxID=1503053 RepID=A0A103DV65_9BURK|nr:MULTISPECIES: LEA type 2 family protein [Burkholderia]AOK28576.1 water stress/hypersensitive response domain-containing protein [Burkholderia sp. Bp7605]KVE23323.1 water stress/hypersensitive response domain-containing protein [Burkholderia singularis]SMG01948.1 Phosphonate ABC transporter phosphate-binding periplasmic component (TC 3.A.1.9.1) [Burkholderia singularis]
MRALSRSRRVAGQLFAILTVLLTLGGCAALTMRDPVRVNVVGIEPLAGQGLEMRFNLKLRVQNPNDAPIDYDGVALDLELNGKPFASGVSDAQGTVPRFGEQVLSVPVTVSAFSVARQAFGLPDVTSAGKLPYVLRGKLAAGVFGGARFTDSGTLSLPASPSTPIRNY